MDDITQSRRFSILKPNNDGDEPTARSTVKFGLRKSESRRVSFSTFKEVKEFCPVSTVNDMTEMPDSTIPVELSSSNNSESTPMCESPCGSRILQRTMTTWRDENVMEETLILSVKETDLVDKENIIHHQLNNATKALVSQSEYVDVVDSAIPCFGNISYAGMELTLPLHTQASSIPLSGTCSTDNPFATWNVVGPSSASLGSQIAVEEWNPKGQAITKESAPSTEVEDDGMDLTDTENPAIIISMSQNSVSGCTSAKNDKPMVAGATDHTVHQLSMDITAHVSGKGVISVCREELSYGKGTTKLGTPEEVVTVNGEQHIQEVSMGLMSHQSSEVVQSTEQETYESQEGATSGDTKESTIPMVEEKALDISMDLISHPTTDILVPSLQEASVAQQSTAEFHVQQDMVRSSEQELQKITPVVQESAGDVNTQQDRIIVSSEQELQEVSMELTSHPLASQICAPNAKCEENATTGLVESIQHISMDLTNRVCTNVEINPETLTSPEHLAHAESMELVTVTGFVAEKAAEVSCTPPSELPNEPKDMSTKGPVADAKALDAQKNADAGATQRAKKVKKVKEKRTTSAEPDDEVQVKRSKSAPSSKASKIPVNAGVKRPAPVAVGTTERTHSEKKLPRTGVETVQSAGVRNQNGEAIGENQYYDSEEVEELDVREEVIIERDGITLFLDAYKGKVWRFQREGNVFHIAFGESKTVQVDITFGPEYMERGVKNWVFDDIKLATLRKRVKSCWGRLALKLVENNPAAKSSALLKSCDCTSKLAELMNHLESLVEPMIVFLNDDVNRFKGYCYRHVWDEDKHTLTMRFTHFFTKSYFDLHMRLSDTFPLKAVDSKIETLEQGGVRSKDITQLLQIISSVRAENPYFCNVGKCVEDFLDCLPEVVEKI